MLKQICCQTDKVTFVRRLVYVVPQIPEDTPDRWNIIRDFSCHGVLGAESLTTGIVKTIASNMEYFERDAYHSDDQLKQELASFSNVRGIQLAVILISQKQKCMQCGNALSVRSDRPSQVTLYSERHGTLKATHFRKLCKSIKCSFVQHYGYHSSGSENHIRYDEDWQNHQWFLSTRETGFEISFLAKFDAELLIGQISYHQKAEIYNYLHEFCTSKNSSQDTTKDGTPR